MSEITYGKATEANIKLARQAIIEIEEETKAVGTSRRTVEKTINEKLMVFLVIEDYGHWEVDGDNHYWIKKSDENHSGFESNDELNRMVCRYAEKYPTLEFNWQGGDDKSLILRVSVGGESALNKVELLYPYLS